jgi:hypothetical protein
MQRQMCFCVLSFNLALKVFGQIALVLVSRNEHCSMHIRSSS